MQVIQEESPQKNWHRKARPHLHVADPLQRRGKSSERVISNRQRGKSGFPQVPEVVAQCER